MNTRPLNLNLPAEASTDTTTVLFDVDDLGAFRRLVAEARELDEHATLSWNYSHERPQLGYVIAVGEDRVRLIATGPTLRPRKPALPDVEKALADA